MAQAMLFSGEADDALNELEPLQDSALVKSSAKHQVRLLNLLALVQTVRQRFDYALKIAQMAIDVADQADDGRLRAQSGFINFYVHDKSSAPVAIVEFERLDASLAAYGMDSSRIYCLRNFYTYLRSAEPVNAEKVLAVTRSGLELARRTGHRQGVAAIYHSKGILYSYEGRHQAVLRCFGISEKLRMELGEAMEIVRMHNGIGYFHFLAEQYSSALEHLGKAYTAVRRDVDMNELVMTLHNFAKLYVCTRRYQDALQVLEHLVRICRIRQVTHFPFHNLFDVFSLKGFCHLKLGEPARAQQCFDRMKGLAFEPSLSGKFLQILLQGALYAATNRLAEAQKTFESAPDALGKAVEIDTYLLPLCYLELLNVHSRQSNWKACETVADAGLKFCGTRELPQSSAFFRHAQQVIRDKKSFYSDGLPPVSVNVVTLQLDELVRLLHQENKLKLAHHRLREVQLVSRLQSLPERVDSPRTLADETLKLICASISELTGRIHIKEVEGWKLWCEIGHLPDVDRIEDYLQRLEQAPQLFIDTELNVKENAGRRARFNSFICLPIMDEDEVMGVMILSLLDSNRFFEQQDQETFQLLVTQFGSQLQRLKQRERLVRMSTTDVLTGLFNRQAMQARLEQELQLMHRVQEIKSCSLAYIDLDNFKSVNDTLGHAVGDKVLKAFSKLLLGSLRHGDVAARWGGDEFVVLLPDTEAEQAKLAAERFMENIAKRQNFKRELAEWAGPFLLPYLAKLGCSIGVAACRSDQLEGVTEERLLLQADKALYMAKEAGKGRVCIADPD
jgi:diguanylate cyclase (GGDEF)-like protein